MTGNLFDNAKFGDMFLTTENKQAVFLRFAENAEYKFAFLYVEDWGNVQVFRHNGKEIYNDAAHSIISKKEEPVSKELEKAAQEYVTKEGYLAGLHYNSMVRSFKAGAEWKDSHDTKLPNNLLLAAKKASIAMCNYDDNYLDEYPYEPIVEQKFIEGAQWHKEQMMSKAIDGKVIANGMGNPILHLWDKGKHLIDKKVKVIVIEEE